MKTIIIGENLNSSRKKIRDMLVSRDVSALTDSVKKQIEGGADYIDINASILMDGEKDALFWAGDLILNKYEAKLSIDSPDLDLLSEAAERYGAKCIINSLTCDEDQYKKMLPRLKSSGSSFILLLKSREGIPSDAGGRISLARKAVRRTEEAGIPSSRVFIDPVFAPVATEFSGNSVTLSTLEMLSKEFSSYGRVGGLSNISYGLPNRRLLNRTFLSMALAKGITALICDPTDQKLVEMLKTSEAIMGYDTGCREFLRYYRANRA
ncbi:MAG: dihydropteroate synthase [Candidatus Krumholzibacteriota bacterium]|nr:dihydropteroate synthase [Candidatus Krumholzibacteriota bacterium]